MLRELFCRGKSDYEICEEHGHDYRDDVQQESTIEDATWSIRHYNPEYADLPNEHSPMHITDDNKALGAKVRRREISVCRDCGHEKASWWKCNAMVRCEDGKLRPFNDLFSVKEDNE